MGCAPKIVFAKMRFSFLDKWSLLATINHHSGSPHLHRFHVHSTLLLRLFPVLRNRKFFMERKDEITPTDSAPSGLPTRLVAHFSNKYVEVFPLYYQADSVRSRDSQIEGWSELWDSEQSDLWDRGVPSPALIDFVESRPNILPQANSNRRLRALVPVRYSVNLLDSHSTCLTEA